MNIEETHQNVNKIYSNNFKKIIKGFRDDNALTIANIMLCKKLPSCSKRHRYSRAIILQAVYRTNGFALTRS